MRQIIGMVAGTCVILGTMVHPVFLAPALVFTLWCIDIIVNDLD